jgi:GT2 family glycosyltransferase
MIVPVLTRPEILYRMLGSIDYPIDRLVVIDNGDCVDPDRVRDNPNVTGSHVVKMPANLGVSGSWNLGIKATPFAPYWLIANFDLVWNPGSLEALDLVARTDALVLSGAYPAWSCFLIGEKVVETVGLFDESFHPAYFEDNDYDRRAASYGVEIVRSGIPVRHYNSSTLEAGYASVNSRTFGANETYYARKIAADDFSEGRWDLTRRRENSWD